MPLGSAFTLHSVAVQHCVERQRSEMVPTLLVKLSSLPRVQMPRIATFIASSAQESLERREELLNQQEQLAAARWILGPTRGHLPTDSNISNGLGDMVCP